MKSKMSGPMTSSLGSKTTKKTQASMTVQPIGKGGVKGKATIHATNTKQSTKKAAQRVKNKIKDA